MNNQEILDNAPEGATHINDGYVQYLRASNKGYMEQDASNEEWDYAYSNHCRTRSLADIKRIMELEGFNIGLANESCAQQERIAELENQWISVEDRLPEFHKQILFYAGKIDGSLRGALYRHSHRFQDAGGNFFYKSDVTHWMPLPEPPKEKE